MKSNAQKQFQHFALDINDNIIDIRKTADFESQNYYCPHCHNEMITRRGNIRQWHFAHKADKCSYDKYLHSIAEIFIMDWFNKNQSIMLFMNKNLKCNEYNSCLFYNEIGCNRDEIKQYDLKQYYSKCIQEYRYGGFVADLYCENNTKPNSPIFIEISVTHKCSPEKINSGIRIIELNIKSEVDIIRIINSNKFKESDKIKFYNFQRKEILVDSIEQDFQKYILHSSLKHYVDKRNITCRNYAQNRKGIYEMSLPYHDCLPIHSFINYGGVYKVGIVKAYIDDYLKKECSLCKWQKEDFIDRFCTLYKRCGNPKYCKDNDATRCTMFKVDTDAINNVILGINEYLEHGYIDIWKAEK